MNSYPASGSSLGSLLTHFVGRPGYIVEHDVKLNNNVVHGPIVNDRGCSIQGFQLPIVVNNANVDNQQVLNTNDYCINDIEGLVKVNKHSGDTFTDTEHLNNMDLHGGLTCNELGDQCVQVFYINASIDDKFVTSLLLKSVTKHILANEQTQCDVFQKCKMQSDFQFGFIPLSNLIFPQSTDVGLGFESPVEQRFTAKKHGVPNFVGARIPVKSQLNVQAWEIMLENYWDEQLIELICHGFPLDFNRESVLVSDMRNHVSAIQFPHDVDAYLSEECSYDTILCPFTENPINGCHYSPFMTQEKSGSGVRRVIID